MSRWVSFSCPENYIRDEFIKELNEFFHKYNIDLTGADILDSIRWLDESPLPDADSAADYLINYTTIEKDCNRAVRYHTNDIVPSSKNHYDELCERLLRAGNEYERLRRLPLQAFAENEVITCENCGTTIYDDDDFASLIPIHYCPKCESDLRSPVEKEALQNAEQASINAMTECEEYFKNHRIATSTRWFVIVKVGTDEITYRDMDWRIPFILR